MVLKIQYYLDMNKQLIKSMYKKEYTLLKKYRNNDSSYSKK